LIFWADAVLIGQSIKPLLALIYLFNINQSISFQIMPSRNTVMAMALIMCITFRLKLVGLFGSFFRKKYIYKYKQKEKVKAIASAKLKRERPKHKALGA